MDEEKDKLEKEEVVSALTRREWLLGVGPAVVLSSLSSTLPTGESLQAARTALPSGLYAPSFDHLRHALTNENAFLPAPSDSATEYVRPRKAPFVPQGFAEREFRFVRQLTEFILGEDLKTSQAKPEHGAPASIYDEVAEWIDLVVASAPRVRAAARSLPAENRALAIAYFGSEEPVRELETYDSGQICREGLAWLEEESQGRFGKKFLDADVAGQTHLVQAIGDARSDKSVVNAGTRLFDFLKAECIRGFYTSRIGLKELDYKGNSFYGEPPGCGLTEKVLPHPMEAG